MMRWFFIVVLLPHLTFSRPNCGGVFTAKRGNLQTPNFPKRFKTPIECEWVIKSEKENSLIVVYLTQMYVKEGITFTEYVEYDKRLPGVSIAVEGGDVAKARYVQCNKNVLVITLKLNSLENNHIRVEDNFMDVYGFNITYEITDTDVRKDHCIMMDCGYTGICYDYLTEFKCDCFDGYSGPKCSEGPKSYCYDKTGSPVCQNGANCRHIGDNFIKCECAKGFQGEYCNIQSKDCEECLVSCMYDGQAENVCKCADRRYSNINDLQVYTTTSIHIKNIPLPPEENFTSYVTNQVVSSFGENSAEIKDLLHLTNIESFDTEFGITLRFYGSKANENRTRSAINRWGEMGLIGNMTVVTPHPIDFLKEPIILAIQSIGINPEGTIHENDEFILSCSAQGSPNMSFRWYKDGVFVNVTRTKSNKWVRLRKGSTLTNYIAILTVDRATVEDGGLFTCQVEDYNIQQCLSKRVSVKARPAIMLDNMSLTVAKGESFSIKCSSDGNGLENMYSWTKNGNLLPIKTKRERYENLYLMGSILQVSGLSRSANYSCLVQDGSVLSEANVFVTVIDRDVVNTCGSEVRFKVPWPETAPGSECIQLCPENYRGVARRWCRMQDANLPSWELPDMSSCVFSTMGVIMNKFKNLRLGYECTTPIETLTGTLEYVKQNTFLEGEGYSILRLLNEIFAYINEAKYSKNIWDICNITFNITDTIMSQQQSLISEQQVVELQRTIKTVLISCKRFFVPTDSFNEVYNTAVMNIQPVNKLTDYRSYSSGFSVNSRFILSLIEENKPYFGSTVAVIYNNLDEFLPPRSVLRINDSELEYKIVSKIIGLWYTDDKNEIPFSNKYNLHIQFAVYEIQLMYWNLTCARTEIAPYGYFWDTTSCSTKIVNSTTIDCNCNRFGTFAVISTQESSVYVHKTKDTPNFIIIVIGCSICLCLAVFTGLILLFQWIFNRSCVIFLKVQCCGSIIGGMAVFILAQTSDLKSSSYLYVSTFLQIFFLTAVSTHLSILFVIYTDLLKFRNTTSIKPTSVFIITGAPIILVFGNYLSHVSMHIELYSWWIIKGTTSFCMFVVCCCILVISFYTMYYITLKYIKLNANVSISRDRIILLKKTVYTFHMIIIVILSSIVYINLREQIVCHFIFSITSIALGIVVLFCYILRSEIVLREYFLKQNKCPSDCKINSFNSNHQNIFQEDKGAPTQVDTENDAPQQKSAAGQFSGPTKQLIASIDYQKQIKGIIKRPDILSRNCVSFDLVSSNNSIHCQECTFSSGGAPDERELKKCDKHRCFAEAKSDACSKHFDETNSEQVTLEKLESNEMKLDISDERETSTSHQYSKYDSLKRLKSDKSVSSNTMCSNIANESDGGVGEPRNTNDSKSNAQLDAVMCSISNDLDYLLNRNQSCEVSIITCVDGPIKDV